MSEYNKIEEEALAAEEIEIAAYIAKQEAERLAADPDGPNSRKGGNVDTIEMIKSEAAEAEAKCHDDCSCENIMELHYQNQLYKAVMKLAARITILENA